MQSKYDLLRSKKILSILDGDENFGEFETKEGKQSVNISMPYLSGPVICGISTTFGLVKNYGWGGGAQSRWSYLDDLLEYCIANNKANDLLFYLFNKSQFSEKLRGNSSAEIDSMYQKIVSTVIEKINGELYFSGNELVLIGKQFIIRQLNSTITVEAPIVKKIDREYIKDLSGRAMKDIEENNFDSAITKSRTLLEEVFCYVIERKGEEPSESGNIVKLYNQVKTLYTMHQDENTDKRINMLLSGLEKIITSISQMRNEGSDSHGVGAKRIRIAEHHARLFVNSALTIADFILAVGNKEE
jgi:hypothetical protein